MTLHDNQYSLSLLRHGSCGYNCDINWSPQVSFFITTPFSRRRRSLRAASFDDYKDIALTSGGQAIHVSKSELSQATDIILDTSTSALVWFYSSVNIMRLIWLDYCLKNRDRRVSRSFSPLSLNSVRWQFFSEQEILERKRPSPSHWMSHWKTSLSTSQEDPLLSRWQTLLVPLISKHFRASHNQFQQM